MSASSSAQIEVAKLARVLGVGAERLAALAALDPSDLRALRHQVADALVGAERRKLKRLAALASTIPAALTAKLAEQAFGPVLTARTAGFGDANLILGVAKRASPEFLADVAVELDPRHTDAAIAKLPAGPIAAAAAELERREEYAAMGVFVGFLSPDALAAALDTLSDDSILRVGALIEAPERLDEIVGHLPSERLEALAEIASGQDRRPELLAIAEHLGPVQRGRLLAGVRDIPAGSRLS